jgi:hypothetical protein
MSKIKVVKETPKVSAGNDSMFFAGQYPDWMTKKTDMEWVKYMNKKYGFKWNGKDSK